MPRPPRSPYTPEDRQRALTALYASGDEVDGEWVPNFTAVSRREGMPTHPTLSKWWADRDATQDFRHLGAAQRAREQARLEGGEEFFTSRLRDAQEALEFIFSPDHRTDGKIGPGMERTGIHQYARAIREGTMTLEKVRDLLGMRGGEDASARLERRQRMRERMKQTGLLTEEGE